LTSELEGPVTRVKEPFDSAQGLEPVETAAGLSSSVLSQIFGTTQRSSLHLNPVLLNDLVNGLQLPGHLLVFLKCKGLGAV
jgi:hypothetical protein